jgi:hypothetical protein
VSIPILPSGRRAEGKPNEVQRAPIPDDDDVATEDLTNWPPREGAATDPSLPSVERLHAKLVTNRARLVRSLAAKMDPATLASLATVGLAIAQIEAVLREAGRPVKF